MTFQPARRGDLVVIVINHPDLDYQTVEIMLVTSITRDGHVKATQNTWGTTLPLARQLGVQQTLVVSKTEVDVDAVMAAARAHTWPGHPNQPMHYDTLAEVRQVLAPHRLQAQPTDRKDAG